VTEESTPIGIIIDISKQELPLSVACIRVEMTSLFHVSRCQVVVVKCI